MSEHKIPVRYAPDLQEAAVLRALERRKKGGNPAVADDYRKAADRIYAQHDDAESRRGAFQALHARLFGELEYSRPIDEALKHSNLRFDAVFVTRAWSPPEEGAALSVDGKTLGMRIMVDRFGSPDLPRLLRHELGHVIDMLDPAFGYGLGRAVSTPGAHRIEDRFSLLWDCVVDGRTAAAGGQPLATRSERYAEFRRLFPEFTPDAAEIVVGSLWGGARPTYHELISLARDPQALAVWCGLPTAAGMASAQSAGWSVAVPGAPCPLCGFPTFSWKRTIPTAIAERIVVDFPTWSPGRGACERCVEGYAVPAGMGGIP
jgi:hypothetical protein